MKGDVAVVIYICDVCTQGRGIEQPADTKYSRKWPRAFACGACGQSPLLPGKGFVMSPLVADRLRKAMKRKDDVTTVDIMENSQEFDLTYLEYTDATLGWKRP